MKLKISSQTIFLFLLVLFLVIFFFPVKVPCRVPGYTCASAPDENGRVTITVDLEPWGIKQVEKLTGQDNFLKYKNFSTFKTVNVIPPRL